MRALVVAALLLCAGTAASANDPICPDRPGKGTGTCTVPASHWQVETGFADWTLQKAGGERETSLVLGETTAKYGLTNRSDIEVDVTPWQRATSGSGGVHDSASGFGDVKIIYKYQLASTDAALQVAAMPVVKLPTANHSLGNGKWEGGLLVPVGYAIPYSPLAIGLTPEIDWVADADGRGHHAAMVQVASLGWQVSKRLNLSAEIWGQWDWDPAGTTRQASANGSIAYLVTNNMQVDGGANFGLNEQTPDAEIYSGVSVRF